MPLYYPSGENDTGMSRLSLSDSDREVRNWFVETAKQIGCIVTIDAMGNIFAVRPGKKAGPPTCAGSHLDTQPSGGRYVTMPRHWKANFADRWCRMEFWESVLDWRCLGF